MPGRRRLDDIRQRVEQVCHLEWLAEAWPLGVLAGQHAIAGDKDKGDIATGQVTRTRRHPLACQIDVEHRGVTSFPVRRVNRLRKPWDRTCYDTARTLQH